MDYKIGRSTRTCCVCERKFKEGEQYTAAIFEDKDEFERREFCGRCWSSDEGGKARNESFSYWVVKVPEKGPEEKRVLDVEAATQFFRKLAGSEDEHKRDFAYLLALLLMRKKILLMDDTVEENGKEYLVLHFRGEDAEDSYKVEDPKLTADELERVKDDLGGLLNMET